MKLRTIGVPIEEGCEIYGSRKSIDYLKKVIQVDDIVEIDHNNPDHIQVVLDGCKQIKEYSEKAFEKKQFPFLVGGDHSMAIGSLAAIKDLKHCAIIWVDAHTDINSDQTSVTKRIHGMPLSVALGDCYKPLVDLMPEEKLDIHNIYYLGLRSIDEPEQERIDFNHLLYFTMDDIDKMGLGKCLQLIKQQVKIPVHLSVDLDAIDPQLCTGVNTPVCGGISVEQFKQCISFTFENFEVVSADLVEYNPVNDDGNTIDIVKDCVDLIKSYVEKMNG